MASLWGMTSTVGHYNRLERDAETDVLVIGGGMAGALCAYFLKQSGVDVILTEADRIGCGATLNTTAKITAQHGLIYSKLTREFGAETAALYLRANLEAIERYRGLCAHIDCCFEERDNVVYTLKHPHRIVSELDALAQIGYRAEKLVALPLPLHVKGAVKFTNQAQFHPGLFLAAILKGLRVYEHTPVTELLDTTAITPRGRICANRIVIATHFPFLNKHGGYFLKLYQSRSYVIALENAAQAEGMYVDEDCDGLSFRNYGNLLLLGGGGHRTGKRGGGWNELSAFAALHYPDAKEKYRWVAQDCMTLDSVPYIGRYAKNTERLYVAAGFNKWGMTSSMVAALLLTDMLLHKTNPYESVFCPSRTTLRPQLAANGVEALLSLLTPTVPRCPHLGCALHWNPQERSWDCPCHGSRFDESGELIDNPATGDLKRR